MPTAPAWGGIAGVQRPGIVHRLDRDTSGLLMVARRDSAQASIMAQLKARRVKKTYQALVQGSVSAAVGRIEAPIGRDPKHRTKMAVVPDGRPSVTGYRVRERFADWTLLDLDLVTGRTHQIRVHLEAIGHPIAGDPVYGTGTSRRGPAGLASAVPPRLAARAHIAERRPPHPGDGAAAARARIRPGRPARGGPVTEPGLAAAPEAIEEMDGANGAMLVIISGPSGVGKDTIIDALRERSHDPEYHYVVTCTTRAARPGEVDGVDYHFLDAPGVRRTAGRRAASSRRTRSTATGTARRAARSGRHSPPAGTSSSRSTSRARRWSRARSRAPS